MSIRVSLPRDAEADTGFVCSPALEAVLSLSVLAQPNHHPLHKGWVEDVRGRLPLEVTRGLGDFGFRHMDYIPPGLVPTGGGPVLSFADDLARIRALPLEQQWVPILRNLTGVPPSAWESPDEEATRAALLERAAALSPTALAIVRLGLDRPEELVDRFLGFLDEYWRLVFADVWETQRLELEAAIKSGEGRVAEGGLTAMLGTLRPAVSVDYEHRAFSIRRDHDEAIELGDRTPVRLIPSGFLWPHIGLVHDPGAVLAVLYPVRLATPLASRREDELDLAALMRALGDRTRLQALRLIGERPRSTQELAKLIGLSEPAMSRHLRQLASVGVLEGTRRGHYLLYRVARGRLEMLSAQLASLLPGDSDDG